ncbi:MAG: uracil-DNA glycosylase [Patescibacteria group bacterium]|jgi:DNA polymerase
MTKQEVLAQISKDIREHTCSLRAGCIQAVPGDGDPEAEVVFIGEGPGKVEDEQGRPFVGPAGKVLEGLLNNIGLRRSDIYITNVVKCRPPENRDPSPSEVAEHAEFLKRELELIKPKLIVLLGRHALHWFMPNEQIGKVRGRAKRQGDKVFFPIYHPAAVLHNPPLMKDLQEDFAKIPILLKKVDELPPVADKSQPNITQSSLFEIK